MQRIQSRVKHCHAFLDRHVLQEPHLRDSVVCRKAAGSERGGLKEGESKDREQFARFGENKLSVMDRVSITLKKDVKKLCDSTCPGLEALAHCFRYAAKTFAQFSSICSRTAFIGVVTARETAM